MGNLSEPEGAFRATFEDKILMSDIVFVKTWFNVEVPKFYALVTNLLQHPDERSSWRGMRTVGEIKRDANIKNDVNKDNLTPKLQDKKKCLNPCKFLAISKQIFLTVSNPSWLPRVMMSAKTLWLSFLIIKNERFRTHL